MNDWKSSFNNNGHVDSGWTGRLFFFFHKFLFCCLFHVVNFSGKQLTLTQETPAVLIGLEVGICGLESCASESEFDWRRIFFRWRRQIFNHNDGIDGGKVPMKAICRVFIKTIIMTLLRVFSKGVMRRKKSGSWQDWEIKISVKKAIGSSVILRDKLPDVERFFFKRKRKFRNHIFDEMQVVHHPNKKLRYFLKRIWCVNCCWGKTKQKKWKYGCWYVYDGIDCDRAKGRYCHCYRRRYRHE